MTHRLLVIALVVLSSADAAVAAVCGDGIVDPAEECDDQNTSPGDGCDASCKREPSAVVVPVCGNKTVEPPETCDDGNLIDWDTCPSNCVLPTCGNSVIERGEVCDDGNTDDGDTCAKDCRASDFNLPPICELTSTGAGQFTLTARGDVEVTAVLQNPPRTRVTMVLDTRGNGYQKSEGHEKVEWDPTIDESLQRTVDLSRSDSWLGATWNGAISVDRESFDIDRDVVLLYTTFGIGSGRGDRLAFTSTSALVRAGRKDQEVPAASMTLVLTCQHSLRNTIDAEEVKDAGPAYGPRGLLESAVPAPLVEAFDLLAEIAIERAKAGALDLVRRKFVAPLCEKLTLFNLGLSESSEAALPRVCALLESLRLEDVMSSGRSLVGAMRDDLRMTVMPRILEQLLASVSSDAIEISKLGLKIANNLLDGRSGADLQVEVALAVLDRLPWTLGLDIAKQGLDGLVDRLDPDVLSRALDFLVWAPTPLEAKTPPAWTDVPDCTFVKERWPGGADGTTPSAPMDYDAQLAAVRRCIDALAVKIKEEGVDQVLTLDTDLQDFLGNVMYMAQDELIAWLSGSEMLAPVEAACTVRLAVGVIKKCSGEECSPVEVAEIVRDPSIEFENSGRFPDALCWSADGTYRLPSGMFQSAVDLAARFLDLRVAKVEDGRTTAIATVRWIFDAARLLAVDKDGRDGQDLRDLEDAIIAVFEEDYPRALTSALGIALRIAEAKCAAKGGAGNFCEVSAKSAGALKILGALASYVRVHAETTDADAAEARAARKKALESIIDSVTDRSERGDHWVFSIGSTPGFALGLTWTHEPGPDPGTSVGDTYRECFDETSLDTACGSLQPRLPVGFFVQRLPHADKLSLGFHAGLWFLDLGQFARGDEDGVDEEVSWNDFIGLGAQVGMLVGTSAGSFVIGAEASWQPGGYERDVVLDANQSPTPTKVSGAFQLGLLLSYYIPFVDLN